MWLVASAVACHEPGRTIRAVETKSTVVCVREVAGLLSLDQPTDVSPETVAAVLARHQYSKPPVDAWGHPFVIEVFRSPDGLRHYRVTAVGRDGRRGSCCTPLVDNLDDDVVFEDASPIQNWRPGAR